jgi:hypothetical protein
LKAQVYVVCNKTKLVGVLFEKEPNVPLLVGTQHLPLTASAMIALDQQ